MIKAPLRQDTEEARGLRSTSSLFEKSPGCQNRCALTCALSTLFEDGEITRVVSSLLCFRMQIITLRLVNFIAYLTRGDWGIRFAHLQHCVTIFAAKLRVGCFRPYLPSRNFKMTHF